MQERTNAPTRRKLRRIGFKTIEQLDAWLVTTHDYAARASVIKYFNTPHKPYRRDPYTKAETKVARVRRLQETYPDLTRRQARKFFHYLNELN